MTNTFLRDDATFATPPYPAAVIANATDYFTGNWTPTIVGLTTAGSVSYSSQLGSYERLGRLVIARFNVQLSSTVSGAAGNMAVGGLPVANNNSELGTMYISFWAAVNITGFVHLSGIVDIGLSAARLLASAVNGAGANIASGAFVNGSQIIGTAIYHT